MLRVLPRINKRLDETKKTAKSNYVISDAISNLAGKFCFHVKSATAVDFNNAFGTSNETVRLFGLQKRTSLTLCMTSSLLKF